jgi:hypothetical protein
MGWSVPQTKFVVELSAIRELLDGFLVHHEQVALESEEHLQSLRRHRFLLFIEKVVVVSSPLIREQVCVRGFLVYAVWGRLQHDEELVLVVDGVVLDLIQMADTWKISKMETSKRSVHHEPNRKHA